MALTTRGCEQTIHPSMSSVVQDDMIKKKDGIEAGGELVVITRKEEEVSHKVVLIHRPLPPFL